MLAINDTSLTFLKMLPAGKSVYLITSKGGAGHLQAANAIEEDLKNQKIAYKKVDQLEDHYIPAFLARYLTGLWDLAKKQGDIQKLKLYADGTIWGIHCKKAVDTAFFLPVFLTLLFRLLSERSLTAIIDTQPLCTGATAAAARIAGKLSRRYITVYKVLTDFPTEKCVHFSKGIRALSKKNRSVIRIISTHPLLGKYSCEKEFWSEVFGVEMSQVHYDAFPVRAAFRQKQFPNLLSFAVSSKEEIDLLQHLFQTSKTNSCLTLLKLPPHPWAVISLGSQVPQKAALDYIEKLLRSPPKLPLTIFITCGNKEQGLWDKAAAIARNNKTPHTLVPLTFQTDKELAPLFHLADFGIYTTGGCTLQEVYSVAAGKIYLHQTLQGAIIWEEGNFEWMRAFASAQSSL